MKYEETVRVIKNNYPPEKYTMLREALDLAIKVLQEKVDESDGFNMTGVNLANTEGIAMKYTVIKNSDIESILTYSEKEQLANICKEINFCRATRGMEDSDRGKNFNLKPQGMNTYLVINTDEPYADEIIEIMKRHGHWG